MTELPSVAVVIPAFNAERFLARAVESVFATGYPNLSVAIVDDGSTDATVEVAAAVCIKYSDRCRLLRHPDCGNHGVGASRNLGIAADDSEWIAWLDADDFYLPNRFDAFSEALAQGQAFDALYEICEIRSDDAGQAPSPASAGNRFGIDRELTGAELLGELLQGKCWATSAITIRRTLLNRTGLFDPDKRIAEDCDLWFRIAAAGRIVAGDLEQPVSVYWRHADNTYTYKVEHRVAMVRAMLDAWRWAERNASDQRTELELFATAIPIYVSRSVIAARKAGLRWLAWQLIWTPLLAGRLRCLQRGKIWRQAVGLIRDTCRFHAREKSRGT